MTTDDVPRPDGERSRATAGPGVDVVHLFGPPCVGSGTVTGTTPGRWSGRVTAHRDDPSARGYPAPDEDLVGARRDLFEDLQRRVGPAAAVLGFDCIHCKLEAEAIDGRRSIERLFGVHEVVGFSSYGEQFVGAHVNQTFTGVAIGRRPQ